MQNPQLTGPRGEPVPMPDEIFVLSRHGISFSAKSGSTKLEARGDLFLSTLRIVFVANGGAIEGFDLPLATMQNERFNQPIFGANNMTGVNAPLPGGNLTDDIKWTLAFKDGGVGTFLPLFFRLLQEMRRRMSQQNEVQYEHNFATPVAQQVVQQIVHAAYVDPNDPTKLYVSQPVPQQSNIPVAHAEPLA